MFERILLVASENVFLRRDEEIVRLVLWPLHKRNSSMLRMCKSPIYSMVCDEDDVSACDNSVHVFCLINASEGWLDEFHEVFVLDLPNVASPHSLDLLVIYASVIRIVACLPTGSLLEVRRRIPRPYRRILLLIINSGPPISKATCVVHAPLSKITV